MADQCEPAEHEQTNSLQSSPRQDSSVLKSNEVEDQLRKQTPRTFEPPDKEKVLQINSAQFQDRDTNRHEDISAGYLLLDKDKRDKVHDSQTYTWRLKNTEGRKDAQCILGGPQQSRPEAAQLKGWLRKLKWNAGCVLVACDEDEEMLGPGREKITETCREF